MTNEEIRSAAVGALQKPSELKWGVHAPKLRENIGRAMLQLVAQAYDEAASVICFFCRQGDKPQLNSDGWLHGENNRCPAHDIHTLKASLTM